MLLAGGRSRRMGLDKARLDLHGQPLWQRQVEVLRQTGAAEVMIAGPAEGPYAQSGLVILPDSAPGEGPVGGLLSALRAAAHPWLLVVAVDMPRLVPEPLRRLVQLAQEHGRGLVPQAGQHLHPLAAVYPTRMLPLVEGHWLKGERAMHRIVEAGVAQDHLTLWPWQEPADFFANANTPEEWAKFGH